MNTVTDRVSKEEMLLRYKRAVEKAMRRVPVKNGVVDIDSLWVETSIPYDLLQETLSRDDLSLPENVERVNTKSYAGEKIGKQRRTKGRRGDKVRD